MRTDGGEALGGRPHIHNRVAIPWPRPRLIRMAAPQVDYRTSIDGDGNRGADLAAPLEVLDEGGPDTIESAVTFPVHHDVGRHIGFSLWVRISAWKTIYRCRSSIRIDRCRKENGPLPAARCDHKNYW